MSWGMVYALLRRLTPLPPPVAGLLTGASLCLLIDEGLTPLLGTSRAEPRLPALDKRVCQERKKRYTTHS